MPDLDLRSFLKKVEDKGRLRRVDGADWRLEISYASDMNLQTKRGLALLFDNIVGYHKGYRVLTCSIASPVTAGLALNLPQGNADIGDAELLRIVQDNLPLWESRAAEFPPEVVTSAPILENVHSGDDVDILEFPTPLWHELDGNRYIGTGCAVITRDPDTGEVNLGTYRTMMVNKNTLTVMSQPGQHGRIHRDKYHARGQPCPMAVSIGHHPLIVMVAGASFPQPEYQVAGAISGHPVKVVTEEITGLPIPADSEIVLAGWSPPGETAPEGPFLEWPRTYGRTTPQPIINVKRVYHRNDPIILGMPPYYKTFDNMYWSAISKSAQLYDEMRKMGISDIRGVRVNEMLSRLFVVVSLKQRYGGHAMRAALQVITSKAIEWGRYVVVVDDDVDPNNFDEVLWAMATRVDPAKNIHIIPQLKGGPIDPLAHQTKGGVFVGSRAIIDACMPLEWIDEFPRSIEPNPEIVSKVKGKWQKLW